MGTRIVDSPPDHLKIDPLYQRILDQRRVDKMAGEWKPELAGVLEVSARNGSWYVLDGQHRLVAARLAHVEALRVQLHDDLTIQQEAALFAKLNSERVRPTTASLFRARLFAGEAIPTDIELICTAQGVTLNFTSGDRSSRPGSTRAFSTLERIYQYSASLLEQTLRICGGAWASDPKAYTEVPLYGVSGFLLTYARHPRFDERRLIEKLAAWPVSHVIQRSKAVGNTGGSGRSLKVGPRLAVLDLWNYRMQRPFPAASMSELKRISLGENPWEDDK
jgi:hypothetical protein